MGKLPAVFEEVIKNDKLREELRDKFLTGGSTKDWCTLRELVKDRRMLRKAAEEALRHNTNKGSTA